MFQHRSAHGEDGALEGVQLPEDVAAGSMVLDHAPDPGEVPLGRGQAVCELIIECHRGGFRFKEHTTPTDRAAANCDSVSESSRNCTQGSPPRRSGPAAGCFRHLRGRTSPELPGMLVGSAPSRNRTLGEIRPSGPPHPRSCCTLDHARNISLSSIDQPYTLLLTGRSRYND